MKEEEVVVMELTEEEEEREVEQVSTRQLWSVTGVTSMDILGTNVPPGIKKPTIQSLMRKMK